MLIVPYSRPEPNEAELARLRAELKQWSELLDCIWVEHVFFNEKHNSFEGRVAIIATWPSDDPRRELFRQGKIGSDYDILGFLSKDVQNAAIPADASEVWPKVLEILASADNARTPWKVRLAQVAENNRKLREKRKQDFLEHEVHDIASYERERALGNRIVGVNEDLT